MTEPTQHIVSTPDGRSLDVNVYNPDGRITVLVHNGTPASRLLLRGWEREARRLDARLISSSRPGYGDSTRLPGRTVADVVSDSEAILGQLAEGSIFTVGVSGGGPHALACGAFLGDRITAVAALCSVAPFEADGLDFYDGMSEDNVSEFAAAVRGEDEISRTLEGIADVITAPGAVDGMGEALDNLMSPPDLAVADDLMPDLMASTKEGLANGVSGWVDDDLAFVKPWGFVPADVTPPVLVLHGEQDLFVPPAHARWVAERLPVVEARLTPDDGHLSISANHFGSALEWLLAAG